MPFLISVTSKNMDSYVWRILWGISQLRCLSRSSIKFQCRTDFQNSGAGKLKSSGRFHILCAPLGMRLSDATHKALQLLNRWLCVGYEIRESWDTHKSSRLRWTIHTVTRSMPMTKSISPHKQQDSPPRLKVDDDDVLFLLFITLLGSNEMMRCARSTKFGDITFKSYYQYPQ